jgi:uncharacterized membrane protein YcaP (DUF421 family)
LMLFLQNIYQTIYQAIGVPTLSSSAILLPMLIRGSIVYFCGIALARFNKKIVGIRSPFNVMLFIMLGSIFANAIVSAELFLSILVTVVFLVLINGLATLLSFFYPSIEAYIKGVPAVLVKDGQIQWDKMRENFITELELRSELQVQLHSEDLAEVKMATLVSDGSINFIRKK